MPTSEHSKLKILKYRWPDVLQAKTENSYQDQIQPLRFKLKRINSKMKTKYKCAKENPGPPPNPWLTGGTLGSKDTVLVFRTCVLRNLNIEQESIIDLCTNTTTTTTTTTPTTDDGNDGMEIKDYNNEQASTSTSNDKHFNVQNTINKNSQPPTVIPECNSEDEEEDEDDGDDGDINLETTTTKKRTNDSMSSSLSDQSISSISGDTTEIETAIEKIEKTTEEPTKINVETSLPLSLPPPPPQQLIVTQPTPAATKKPIVTQKQQQQQQHSSTSEDKENVNIESVNKTELPGTLLRMSYRFQQTETRLLRKILAGHGFMEVPEDQNFNLLWTGVHIKPDILRNLTPYQRVNHFPRSYELTRKDRLHKNIEKMQHLRGFKYFDIVPQSFILPVEYKDLVSAHNKYRGPWIVKPVASSRGRGIFIVNSPDQISPDEHVVVAKYVADPLCIDGHKCDIRLYVAVTSFDPLLIYMYEEGLVRIATVKYNRNAESLWNPCMHLCNYSINKYHSDYIKSSDADEEDVGHKWTLSALLRHLKSQGFDTEQLMLNIEDVIIKAIMSCTQPIVSACRMFVPTGSNCFELYGFDILIDSSLKPWLLEINLSPSLGIDTPLDAKVKASLLTDLLTLVGIPAIHPISKADYDQRFTRSKITSTSTSTKRTMSANDFSNTKQNTTKTTNFTCTNLTSEENRLIKLANTQYARRGNFVRIYPVYDSIHKYGMFLDNVTGIPTSTVPASSSITCSMIIPHNYNLMLHAQLYLNGCNNQSKQDERMLQYERALEQNQLIFFGSKNKIPKCLDEARRLRKQIRKLIETGNEMSPLQARKAFGLYLEHVLKRLSAEPKHIHEKLILKFIQRAGVNLKTPNFIRDPLNYKIISKDRSAMVAKQLGDYLQIYNRETECFVDSFDRYGVITIKLFNEFLLQAQECDLESVLTLHTNLTRQMPFLYNNCSLGGGGIPKTPPIPTGTYGFLKALPSMVPCGLRDDGRIDSFYKSIQTGKSDKLERSGKLNPLKKKISAKILNS